FTLSLAVSSSLCPYTTLFRSGFQTGKTVLFSTMHNSIGCHLFHCIAKLTFGGPAGTSNALQYAHGVGRDFVCKDLANQFLSSVGDRKSTRLNSSHGSSSYACF